MGHHGPGINIVLFDPAVGEVTEVGYVRIQEVVYGFERDEAAKIRLDEFPYD